MRNNAVADGLINIDLVPAGVGGMNARVTRCILEDANESIVYRHFLANGTDRDSRALIERNVMRHLHGRFGMGIRIIANNRTHGSTLRLVLRRNRIYDAGYGLHAQAEGSSDHHFEIVSDGNLIEGTATGMGLEGEFSRAGVTGNNHVTWLSRNDAIVDNNRDAASLAQFQIPGGVVIRGGIVAAGVTASVNDSSVRIHLEGTHFARGNTQLDLAAYGAWSSGGSVGKRNRVDVVVCDATTEDPTGSFLAVDAVPPDPPSTAAADRNVASIGAANVTFVDGTNAVLAGIPLEPAACHPLPRRRHLGHVGPGRRGRPVSAADRRQLRRRGRDVRPRDRHVPRARHDHRDRVERRGELQVSTSPSSSSNCRAPPGGAVLVSTSDIGTR
jgi:hypothetical protein